MTNKPNILFLMDDEHPVFMTGCYGHRSVKTPSIDSLADNGVVFDAAYCPSPICTPSRAAMMTGRHVHTIGVWDTAAPLAGFVTPPSLFARGRTKPFLRNSNRSPMTRSLLNWRCDICAM